MKVTRIVPVLCALVFPFGVLVVANGCGNKDSGEPATTAAPPPAPTPTPTPTAVMVPEEDAGADGDAGDADADAPKVTGSGDATGIRACCAALAGNANSAPLDQKPMYLQAAAVCQGLVNSPQGRGALVQLRGILRGANMPSSCK
ncbi:MAG: acyltransferase [Polyangiaceae bacterium]